MPTMHETIGAPLATAHPCPHTTPAPFGASEVRWNAGGTGTITTPCAACGEWATWNVQ